MTYIVAGGVIGWLLGLFKKAKASQPIGGTGGHPYPPPKNRGVPFAESPTQPLWPIQADSTNKRMYEVAYRDVNGKMRGNGARAFKARRANGARYHAGIDLYADAGDVVVAPEAGVIVADQNFLNSIPGKDAMLIQGYSGTTILLGEIVAKSFRDFGLEIGSRVERGQPVARVGLTQKGSHMLHFETYTQGSNRNRSWRQGRVPHPTLRDPTVYLLRARATTGEPFP